MIQCPRDDSPGWWFCAGVHRLQYYDLAGLCGAARRQGNCHVCKWRSSRFSTAFPKGVRRWLKFSFNAPVPVRQSQLGSRASGFCSKASLASLYRCAARPAVKCTNGCRRTHGWAACYPRRIGGCSAVFELRLRMFHPGMMGTRNATEGDRLSE